MTSVTNVTNVTAHEPAGRDNEGAPPERGPRVTLGHVTSLVTVTVATRPGVTPTGERWLNLRVSMSRISKRKKAAHLSWNGERFAKGHDFQILSEHYPEVLDYVESVVREAYAKLAA